MTKLIITSYTALLFMTMMLAGATMVLASEVTGTLSSDASSNSQTSGKDLEGTVTSDPPTSGNLEGTVTSDSSVSSGGRSSGSRSGGGSGGNNSNSSNSSAGVVLGESTTNAFAPGFPNAGFAPHEDISHATLWSTMVTFIRNIVSF